MNKLMDTMPDRAFDVGIAEGHAATFSGGMAKKECNLSATSTPPSCSGHTIMSSMTSPCSASPSYFVWTAPDWWEKTDRPTTEFFDLAYFRPIPNLTISSPMDEHELRRLMYTAQLSDKGPFVIRYPRGRAYYWTGNVRWKKSP